MPEAKGDVLCCSIKSLETATYWKSFKSFT